MRFFKEGVLTCVWILLFALFIPYTSAHFVCGIVATDSISPGWLDVSVSYADYPASETTCKVSPANNKFCCDLLDISTPEWLPGMKVSAEILPTTEGYFANEVSMITSEESYDVFPTLLLKELLPLRIPAFSTSKDPFVLNVSLSEPYTRLNYTLFYEDTLVRSDLLCEDCTQFSGTLPLDKNGHYLIIVEASTLKATHTEEIHFTRADRATVTRTVTCEGCEGKILRPGSLVTITIHAELPFYTKGTFADFFPREWEFKDGGVTSEYSETHTKVEWLLDGTTFDAHYTLRVPVTTIPRTYSLWSELGENGAHLAEERYTVGNGRFSPLYALTVKPSKKQAPNDRASFAYASSESPLVILSNRSFLTELALFPTLRINRLSELSVEYTSPVTADNAVESFVVHSSLALSEISTLLIRFRVPNERAGTFSLLTYQSGQWKEVSTKTYQTTSDFTYYEAYVPTTGTFAIRDTTAKRGIFALFNE